MSGPGTLNEEGATYVLTQDVSAPGTAFVMAAGGITLDLNGHTVTYNTAPSSGAVYGVTGGNWARGTFTVTNGRIVQGSGGSGYSHAVRIDQCNPTGLEISHLDITVHGDNCKAVRVDDAHGASYCNIHDNTIRSNVQVCTNRHAYDSYTVHVTSAVSAAIHDNVIVGGHGGIALTTCRNTAVYRNDISHRALAGNGYGVILWNAENVQVHDNYIHTEDGCGVHAGDWYRDVSIYSNTVEVMMDATAEASNVWGMKFRTYPDETVRGLPPGNLKVYSNTVVSTTGSGKIGKAGGIGILDSHDDLNNEYFNNDITVSTSDPTKIAAGIRLAGRGAPGISGTRIYGNTITSNHRNIDIGTSDGRGSDGVQFTSNTLIKGENPLNYHTINIGWWVYTSEDHVFLDTRAQNGASVHDVQLEGSEGGGPYGLYVKWYLDVTVTDEVGTPLPGAAVVATGQSGSETIVQVTDEQGEARLPLTEYYRYGDTVPATSNYEDYTPHIVTVSKEGYFDSSREVTMNASKAIALALTPDSGSDPALSLEKTVDKAEASPGDTVRYTITFSNQGDTTVTSVAIIDPIPAHVTYVAGSTRLNGAPVDPDPYSDGQIRVDVGSLAPGAGGTISFQVRVK